MIRLIKAFGKLMYEIFYGVLRYPLNAIGWVVRDLYTEIKHGWNLNIIYSDKILKKYGTKAEAKQ